MLSYIQSMVRLLNAHTYRSEVRYNLVIIRVLEYVIMNA